LKVPTGPGLGVVRRFRPQVEPHSISRAWDGPQAGWMRDNEGVTLEELRRFKRNEILKIAASHGARNVRVFGSVARGEATSQSDIDLLVDLDPDRTLMDLGGLLMDLRKALDARVDIATEAMLRPRVREQASRDAVPL
jgi:uncharacterized protein